MLPLRLLAFVPLALFGQAVHGAQQDAQWALELLIGDAYNLDSHTRIEQETLGSLSFTGDYKTRGLEGPFHYALRISRWQDARAWELQLLHHKLYLQHPPAGVDSLSVSHGFNIVTINRAFDLDGWRVRAGLGPVITHAEASILGSSYDGPYELAGAGALIGVSGQLELGAHFYLLGDLSGTFGYIRARPDGHPRLEITIRNPAFHAQVGLGYRF
jgi:hypothetical protein